MFKKYALKVSNTFNSINYTRPTKAHSRSSTSDDGGGDSSSRCSFDSNYDQNELNRNLFIENYLIGRGSHSSSASCSSNNNNIVGKMRSSSLSIDDTQLKRNNRRKSFIDKRDDRLKINRNHLFIDNKTGDNKADRAIVRHKISTSIDSNYDDDYYYYEMDDEKSLGCDFFETTAPTLRKINNYLREYVDIELSIVAIVLFKYVNLKKLFN